MPPSAASAADLTVAAAADLSVAQSDLTASFQTLNNGDRVRFVFAASGALAQQIRNGAPYDVFLSANDAFVDQLAADRKLDPGTVTAYALGEVGIQYSDHRTHPIGYLLDPAVRTVALPNPKLAPYGAAARQALESQGLWAKVESKIVYGENVRQALQIFESGNSDAVLTSFSLVSGKPGAAALPQTWHKPIRQKGGVVASTKQHQAAERFMKFLRSDEARRILEAHGLEPED